MTTHRLFIAIRPPEPICDALLDVMEALDGARWQDFDTLHLTLRFVGEVSPRTADDLAIALGHHAFLPLPIAIEGVGHFEKKQRPHAIWARIVPSAPLANLHASMEQACQRAGLAPEGRNFIPHITLARLNRASGDITPWLARHQALRLGPWQADAISLYESHLSQSGARYEEIGRFPARG